MMLLRWIKNEVHNCNEFNEKKMNDLKTMESLIRGVITRKDLHHNTFKRLQKDLRKIVKSRTNGIRLQVDRLGAI